MNANYLYDIFEITNKLHLPDLTLGLAQLQVEKPIPEGLTQRDIVLFIADHYEALVDAFKFRDRKVFAAVVELLVAKDVSESV